MEKDIFILCTDEATFNKGIGKTLLFVCYILIYFSTILT